MKARGWTVACHAECRVCGWTYENHKNGLAMAGKHAKQTGHHVVAEVTNCVAWNAPSESD